MRIRQELRQAMYHMAVVRLRRVLILVVFGMLALEIVYLHPRTLVIVAAAVVIATIIGGVMQVRWIGSLGKCPTCGYALKGVRGRCPECGKLIPPGTRRDDPA